MKGTYGDVTVQVILHNGQSWVSEQTYPVSSEPTIYQDMELTEDLDQVLGSFAKVGGVYSLVGCLDIGVRLEGSARGHVTWTALRAAGALAYLGYSLEELRL